MPFGELVDTLAELFEAARREARAWR